MESFSNNAEGRIDVGADAIDFAWRSVGEMDEAQDDRSAGLRDDGLIRVDFAYRNGDEALLKAGAGPS